MHATTNITAARRSISVIAIVVSTQAERTAAVNAARQRLLCPPNTKISGEAPIWPRLLHLVVLRRRCSSRISRYGTLFGGRRSGRRQRWCSIPSGTDLPHRVHGRQHSTGCATKVSTRWQGHAHVPSSRVMRSVTRALGTPLRLRRLSVRRTPRSAARPAIVNVRTSSAASCCSTASDRSKGPMLSGLGHLHTVMVPAYHLATTSPMAPPRHRYSSLPG